MYFPPFITVFGGGGVDTSAVVCVCCVCMHMFKLYISLVF